MPTHTSTHNRSAVHTNRLHLLPNVKPHAPEPIHYSDQPRPQPPIQANLRRDRKALVHTGSGRDAGIIFPEEGAAFTG